MKGALRRLLMPAAAEASNRTLVHISNRQKEARCPQWIVVTLQHILSKRTQEQAAVKGPIQQVADPVPLEAKPLQYEVPRVLQL